MDQRLLICEIVNTHGLKGEVRAKFYADDDSYFIKGAKIYIENEVFTIEYSKPHKTMLIIKFEGINNINEAEKIKGKKGYVNRSDIRLPKGRYFVVDLIGIDVFTDDEKYVGKITDIFNTGGSDVYEVKDDLGRRVFVPVIEEVVLSIDIDERKVIIKPMDGMIEHEI